MSNFKTSDTAYVQFDKCSLTTATNDAFTSNDSHDIEPTDIITTIVSSCNTVDVRINDEDYGANNMSGWFECHSWLIRRTYTLCDQAHAHVNLYYSAPRLWVVCQEIGHSLSLDHTTAASCMNPNNSSYQHLDSHDKSHLNSKY